MQGAIKLVSKFLTPISDMQIKQLISYFKKVFLHSESAKIFFYKLKTIV